MRPSTSERLTHYETLGVDRNATEKQIKIAYKKLAISLHPDKNAFGAALIKQVNEAKEILLDKAKRESYDRELDRGRRNNADVEASLRHQLAVLERKVSGLETELTRARAGSTTPPRRDNGEAKYLRDQLTRSEERVRRSEANEWKLKSEVNSLFYKLDNAERKNDHLQWEKSQSQTDAANAYAELREERRKSRDLVKLERDRADQRVEEVKKSLSERSTCYRCKGMGADCICCKGFGLIVGKWTKCLKCNGKGSILLLSGKTVGCNSCFTMGAKQGVFSVDCYKCKKRTDAAAKCDVCFEGKIRGFNLKPCPFCEGSGCRNCLEKGFVSCQCGFSCSGH